MAVTLPVAGIDSLQPLDVEFMKAAEALREARNQCATPLSKGAAKVLARVGRLSEAISRGTGDRAWGALDRELRKWFGPYGVLDGVVWWAAFRLLEACYAWMEGRVCRATETTRPKVREAARALGQTIKSI